jgi:cytochrome c oxidase subunit 3
MSDRLRHGVWKLVLPSLALFAGFTLGHRTRVVPLSSEQHRPAFLSDQERTPFVVLRAIRPGRKAAGGFFAGWPLGSADAAVAENVEFQYADLAHQTETAMAGMWLFLATEALFFGSLFFLYAIYRGMHVDAIAEASRHGELAIGTINTAILVSSSAVFVYGLGRVQAGQTRLLFWTSVVTAAFGTAFLLLKAYEWKLDFDDHLFPGPDFSIKGPYAGPAQLFWSFYFIATGLHGLHMIVGIILVGWIAQGARKGRFSAAYHTPVEIVGLYWSFVDMVWLLLYPAIYLAGGTGR